MLEAVEAATIKAATIQSYRTGDLSVQRGNVASLRIYRNDLLAEIERRRGTRPTVSAADMSAAEV
ncbi:MAG: hypothetical protein ABIH03_05935 [Pseudomonadota bacterium]